MKMFDKRLVRLTVTMRIHINVSSQSIFLVRKRNCGYSVCEGGTAGFEDKALVWKRDVKSQYISCAEAELRNSRALFLVTLKSHKILSAEAGLRSLKSQYIPSAEAELRHYGT